jgi:hypothetical protein
LTILIVVSIKNIVLCSQQAVVVQAENKPGEGFFKLARELGLFLGSDELAFWVKELNRVWDYWSSH